MQLYSFHFTDTDSEHNIICDDDGETHCDDCECISQLHLGPGLGLWYLIFFAVQLFN